MNNLQFHDIACLLPLANHILSFLTCLLRWDRRVSLSLVDFGHWHLHQLMAIEWRWFQG